jgi:N-acetylated-alpha-linked acidic dipeptidase
LAQLSALNRLLYQSERVLTAPGGLPGRPWFKHQLYAPGSYTGYGVKTIPYVPEALEQKRPEEAKAGVLVVRDCLVALAAHIDSAAKLLR